MLILLYKVSLLLKDLVAAFDLFIFMPVYCCVFVLLPFAGEQRFMLVHCATMHCTLLEVG